MGSDAGVRTTDSLTRETTMRIAYLIAAAAALGITACSQAEVDQAGDDAAQAASEAGDAMQDAGDAIGEAASDAGDAVEGAVNDAANEVADATDGDESTQ